MHHLRNYVHDEELTYLTNRDHISGRGDYLACALTRKS
jgi:hypothetical protein